MEGSSAGGKDSSVSRRLASSDANLAAATGLASGADSAVSEGSQSGEKYNLRKSSLRMRVEVERKQQQPREKKPKTRPPPLSKYRRRSANARERCRMKEMSDAFEQLKNALPRLALHGQEAGGRDPGTRDRGDDSSSGKPTKVTVLRLAINYIASLRDLLNYNDSNSRTLCGDSDGLSDDLGSDAASTSTSSTTATSGDEESLLSSDMEAAVSDLTEYYDVADLLTPDLTSDLTPDLPEPDLALTLSPEEELCLELVASVL